MSDILRHQRTRLVASLKDVLSNYDRFLLYKNYICRFCGEKTEDNGEPNQQFCPNPKCPAVKARETLSALKSEGVRV